MARLKRPPYQCIRCNYTTANKGHIQFHLFKLITTCPCLLNDIELTDEIKNYIIKNRTWRLKPPTPVFNSHADGYMINGKIIRKTGDLPQLVSVNDLIEVVTGKTFDSALKDFKQIKNNVPEVVALCSSHQFHGAGQNKTPVTNAYGIVTILNLLPGRAAAEFRSTLAGLIVHQMGGDAALIATLHYGEVGAGVNDEPMKKQEEEAEQKEAEQEETEQEENIVNEEKQLTSVRLANEIVANKIVNDEQSNNVVTGTFHNIADSLVAEHGGQIITEIRESDGYVNATKMCTAGNKKWGHYFANKTTNKFLNALSKQAKIPILKNSNIDYSILEFSNIGTLIISQRGGNHDGTWVHPQVAINLATWISPSFAVAVTSLVCRYISGQVTPKESRDAADAVSKRVVIINDFELQSVTNVVDMRSYQLYFRVLSGKFNNVHPVGRPDLIISDEELTVLKIVKFGSMGQTNRQGEHQHAFKGSKLLDSCITLSYTHVEMLFKDMLRDQTLLYEGQHDTKKSKDTELLVIRSQEEYAKFVSIVQTIVANVDGETEVMNEMPLELRLAIEATKQAEEATKQAEEATKQAEEATKQADASTKQAEASVRLAEIQLEILKYKGATTC